MITPRALNSLLEEPFLQHRRSEPGGPPAHLLLGHPLTAPSPRRRGFVGGENGPGVGIVDRIL